MVLHVCLLQNSSKIYIHLKLHLLNMLMSAVTSMANFSTQAHINDPDHTALRGDSLGLNGPGEVSLLNKVPFNRFSNAS